MVCQLWCSHVQYCGSRSVSVCVQLHISIKTDVSSAQYVIKVCCTCADEVVWWPVFGTNSVSTYGEPHCGRKGWCWAKFHDVRLEFLTALNMKIVALWGVTPCSLVGRYQRFELTCFGLYWPAQQTVGLCGMGVELGELHLSWGKQQNKSKINITFYSDIFSLRSKTQFLKTHGKIYRLQGGEIETRSYENRSLCAFVKRTATTGFVTSVRLSASKKSTSIGGIFLNFINICPSHSSLG